MNEKINLTKGRKKKILLVDYRNWLIIFEPNFPSHNYVLTKKNASHGFRPAYCSSLESALKTLYGELVIANIDENNGYGRNFTDLREIIVQTKKEIHQFVTPKIKGLKCEGV